MTIDRRPFYLIACLSFLIFAWSCSTTEAPEGQPMDFSSAQGHQVSQGGELVFTVPEGWVKETPSSRMRRLQYRLPAAAGDAELAVFADIGGTPEQNINRWIGQFSSEDGGSVADQAKVSREQIEGLGVTILDVEGTYSAGMSAPMAGQSGGSLPDYRMLAAVIETGTGPWFVKLTGHRAAVAEWEAGFREFVRSARLK